MKRSLDLEANARYLDINTKKKNACKMHKHALEGKEIHPDAANRKIRLF